MRSFALVRTGLVAGLLAASGCMASTGTPPPMAGPAPAPAPAPAPDPGPAPTPPPAPPPVVVVTPPAPPPAPPAPPAPPTDKWSDRAFDRASNWDKLGERKVNTKADRDTISIGKRKRERYRAVAIVVEKSAIEMFDMVITFGDGTTFSPNVRWVFDAGTSSRVIDLPGDARAIRKIEFRYGNLPGGGKAKVEVWAFDAHDDDGDGHDGGKHDKGRGRGRGNR